MKANFRFMRHYKALLAFAAALVLASIALVAFRGFNYSIDFTGGNMLQLEFPEKVEVGQIRAAMSKVGYGSAVIQISTAAMWQPSGMVMSSRSVSVNKNSTHRNRKFRRHSGVKSNRSRHSTVTSAKPSSVSG